ncbi:Uncharacterized protein PECH_003578 [Penicillium ucsense]|uniref:RRM domain-containing protein n=1 Tax=Penicillium ucsense TaxID=2839758 RepID=A0A8J8VZF9_9EURO|nr:Uncharacterized protein PECM_007993 [Penicillium ucsense]KAF7729388.1 Uncharacterized protein PECH_003578 [Penicillium ucsense]
MPSFGREKGQSSRTRKSDDEYVLFLQGVPAHCRWQELKDLVRQTALHIRQAVVYDDDHGVPTGLGQIIIKNEEEAWRTYHRLSTNGWEGRSLIVTLARTGAPTKPVAGPTRSPSAMMNGYLPGQSTPPPRSQASMMVPPSPISPSSDHTGAHTWPYPDFKPMSGSGPMCHAHGPCLPIMSDLHQCLPTSPMIPCSMFDLQAWHMLPPMYPLSPVQSHHDNVRRDRDGHYTHGAHGPGQQWVTPPSSSSSPVPQGPNRETEIQITNIDPKTTQADVTRLLQDAGLGAKHGQILLTSRTRDDSPTSTHTYTASVIFNSADEAKNAAHILNEHPFKDSQIHVQITTPRPCPGQSQHHPQSPKSGDWAIHPDAADIDQSESFLHETSPDLTCGKVNSTTARKPSQVGLARPLVIDGSGMRKKCTC